MQQVGDGGSSEPAYLNLNTGPNLNLEEHEELLALLQEFRDAFAADMWELGNSDIAVH